MKPLSPTSVSKKSQQAIPDYIIEAVNNLLVKKYHDGHAILLQKEVVKEIRKINPKVKMDTVFENGWMNFEPIFRKAGWEVSYERK
jgi:hypothetical protein